MASSGQIVSVNGQPRNFPQERVDRPLAGFAQDHTAGHDTGWHTHARAQLLYAVTGAMRVETEAAALPGSALLRELILASCAEPPKWDPAGRGPHLAALILAEIRAAPGLPLAVPAPRDARLQRLAEAVRANLADGRTLEQWAPRCAWPRRRRYWPGARRRRVWLHGWAMPARRPSAQRTGRCSG